MSEGGEEEEGEREGVFLCGGWGWSWRLIRCLRGKQVVELRASLRQCNVHLFLTFSVHVCEAISNWLLPYHRNKHHKAEQVAKAQRSCSPRKSQ